MVSCLLYFRLVFHYMVVLWPNGRTLYFDINLLELPILGDSGNHIIPLSEPAIQFPGIQMIPLRESRI